MRRALSAAVHPVIRHLFTIFLHLGWGGLVILGVLDSSFLFLPVGNDMLLVYLIARNHDGYLLYVVAAAFGSAMGVLLLDLVARKGGEEGLSKMMDSKRLKYLEKKLRERAWVALLVSCLAPPPFPFTAVVAAASAFQYPRHRLLAIVFGARAVRFALVGLAAIFLGRHILRIVRSDNFFWFMIAFTGLCAAGSAVSVAGWIRRSRTPSRGPKPADRAA